MAEKIQAIVIKSNDRKEKDKSILLFSLEKGKVWATLRGVKGANAKMKLAKSPFCYGEFILEDGKAGYVVTSFEAKESFHELSEDVDKYFEATAILETLYAYDFSNNEEIGMFFVLLLKSLMRICFGKCRPLYVLDKFLLEVFKLSGFPLYSQQCSCCKSKTFLKHFINFPNGEIVCANCKNFESQELSNVCYLALKILDETSFDKLDTIKLSKESEFQLLKILIKNFECHFDKKLKFLGILS